MASFLNYFTLSNNYLIKLFLITHRQIDGSSPIFSKKPTIAQEDDGRILIFECKIQADPNPAVSWFHNNTLIEPKGRYKVCSSLDNI